MDNWPNTAKDSSPLVGGICHTTDFDHTCPKYASRRKTLSHSGLQPNVVQKCAPHRRTLSRSGFQPNVAQNAPFIGGLCHAAVFDQMWSEMCPSSEDFVTLQTLFSYDLTYAVAQKMTITFERLA